jgi:glycosyltransferase involved in cell wall biosynthesis
MHAGVKLKTLPVNMRLGEALRCGFAMSIGDIVVVLDADLSYSVDHIDTMLRVMREEHAKVVVASPYMKGGETTAIPWHREVMSREVNRLLSATSQSKVKTVTGMVRAYDGMFIRSLPLKSMGPEINTEILYKAQVLRARVAEVPAHLDWSDQTERMAKRKVSIRFSTTSKLLMFNSFLFRPIQFFIIPGLLLFAVAAWSTISLLLGVIHDARYAVGSLHDRFMHAVGDAWQYRPHTFLIAGFSFLLAVQLISLGVLAAQAKRYFEELFYAANRSRRRTD